MGTSYPFGTAAHHPDFYVAHHPTLEAAHHLTFSTLQPTIRAWRPIN